MSRRFEKLPPTPFETWAEGEGFNVTRLSSWAHLVRLMFSHGVPKADLLEVMTEAEKVSAQYPDDPDEQRVLAEFREAIDELNNLPDDE